MLTLIGSLLGFLGSAFPDILKVFRDHQDRKHELAILDRQMEMSKQNHSQKLEEINAQADVAESEALYKHDRRDSGVKWVEALRASVRPVVTYAFFILFAVVKGAGLYLLIHNESLSVAQALKEIWDAETKALFATVIMFWFGQRAWKKAFGGN